MLLEYRNLFKKAIFQWGINPQLNMVSEENLELNLLLEKLERYGSEKLLSRVKKNPDGSKEIEEIKIREWIAEECADVLIMLTQLAMILGIGSVQNQINKKIDRLREKLYEVDYQDKRLKCANCENEFYISEPITADLICPHCDVKIGEAGFHWLKIKTQEAWGDEVHAVYGTPQLDESFPKMICGVCGEQLPGNTAGTCLYCGAHNKNPVNQNFDRYGTKPGRAFRSSM